MTEKDYGGQTKYGKTGKTIKRINTAINANFGQE